MPVFFLPTWFLVIAGLLLVVLYVPFRIIRGFVTSAQEATAARGRQVQLGREVERLELLEESAALHKLDISGRPAALSFHADYLLFAKGVYDLGTFPVWQFAWTKTVSRAMCDRDLRLIRINFEAYADGTDLEFEADVLALIGQLNNESVLRLVRAGLVELETVRTIKRKPAIYSLGIDQRTVLKGADVSDRVLDAMAATSAFAENDPILWGSRPSEHRTGPPAS